MASRYWVGGTGIWDNASTSNWSTTSGGASGASAPVVGDNVFFDASSGTGTVTVQANAATTAATLNSANITLFLGANLTIAGSFTLTLGSLNLNGLNLTCLLFSSNNSTVRTITSGGGSISVFAASALVAYVVNTTNLIAVAPWTVNVTGNNTTGTREVYLGTLAESVATSANIQAGSDTIILGQNSKNLNFTGFSGIWSSGARTIFGDLTLSPTMTMAASLNATTFASTSATPRVITTNGVIFDALPFFNGVGGNFVLGSSLTIPAAKGMTLTNGTFDANGWGVSTGTFSLGVGTKTLTIGSGTWNITGSGGAWNANTNVTNLTVSPSTGTISMTSSSAKTFAGGAKAWPTLNQGGAGALTIQQSNTFTNIANTVRPATITLTAGTTQTVTSFGVSGTAGNLVTLNSSSAGSAATLSDSSGVNTVAYTSVQDIAVTGGASWVAPLGAGNVNVSGNTGWSFLTQIGRFVYNTRKSKRLLV